ncbi:MAG: hypothetical protein IJR42_01275 [Paludibacteraceae bacterium]|nr:hypothetical protein [Paludibacteraceae bacterium]
MAVSLRITASNLEARIRGVMQDAKEAQIQARGLGEGYVGVEEVKMATKIYLEAAQKAIDYLHKADRQWKR